jgi:hypothetical protein
LFRYFFTFVVCHLSTSKRKRWWAFALICVCLVFYHRRSLGIRYDGLDIDFISFSVQTAVPRDIKMSVQMAAVCNAKIDSLLQKKAVVDIFDGSPGFVCSFFCIPKSGDGLFRPIVNLRQLNRCIRYEHFKMENLNTVVTKEGGLYG